jgi:hypothetical protein
MGAMMTLNTVYPRAIATDIEGLPTFLVKTASINLYVSNDTSPPGSKAAMTLEGTYTPNVYMLEGRTTYILVDEVVPSSGAQVFEEGLI